MAKRNLRNSVAPSQRAHRTLNQSLIDLGRSDPALVKEITETMHEAAKPADLMRSAGAPDSVYDRIVTRLPHELP